MYLPFLGLDLLTAAFILIIPLILEFPRVIVKCFLLLYDKFIKNDSWSSSEVRPKVSIIVPAHNEGKVIERTIESLVSLAYPNKEIIVVDDNSSDDTYLKAKPYAVRGDIILVRKREPHSNKAMAVKYGSAFASGEIIVCIDADTILQNEGLVRIVEPFKDPKVVGVAGNVRVYNTRSLLEKVQAYEYLIAMEMGRKFQSLLQILLIIPGAFGAFRRKVMNAIGGIDTDTITEDFDFVLKLRKTGYKVVFAQKAIAWTVVPNTFSGWFRQRVRWAYGQLQSIKKHRDLLFNTKYGLRSVLSLFDMLLMDIFLLFIRFSWLFFLPIAFPAIPLWKIASLILLFYLALEFIQASVALVVSPRGREELGFLLLVPIVVLFYRPLYSFVRVFAYLKESLGFRAEW